MDGKTLARIANHNNRVGAKVVDLRSNLSFMIASSDMPYDEKAKLQIALNDGIDAIYEELYDGFK